MFIDMLQPNTLTEEAKVYTALDAEKERLRQTERLLDEIGAAALAADQRAVQFCSALGVMITIAAQLKPDDWPSQTLQIISLFALLTAAVIAAYTFRPKTGFSSGSRAAPLASYCAAPGCETLLAELAKKNDEAITCSIAVLEKSGRYFACAMKTAAIGIAFLALQIVVPQFQQG
ncbi:hypothetical protein [Paracoccus luteus]|uniref:hypothetical protein n=1 Tax=Paracoccus luteus TaxID=2508543 RepID=UPI00106F985E|nr:hypothetical protein [Paracoccus luteus]